MDLYIDGQAIPLLESEGDTLLRLSLAAGIPHQHACGGEARCSTCRVRVLEGADLLAPPTAAERKLAKSLAFPPEIRLACQCRPRVKGKGRVSVQRLIRDTLDAENLLAIDEAGVREMNLVILFSDLRGFTSFAEPLLPYDTVHILNRYFRVMGDAVLNHHGVIDKYMGDGLMALFGVEGEACEQAAENGLRAGLAMLEALESFNGYLVDNGYRGEPLAMGVGIHAGTVVYGDMGHPGQVSRTAIGDPVNVASRLESATKEAGHPILVSEDFKRLLNGRLHSAGELEVALKGKSEPTLASKAIGLAGSPRCQPDQVSS
ncbi:adenylate/guanylate cyclase domain-containing protein [Magnetospira sp. QH-2]|uniref:adenylate/guanylate cyclase domain-containing protein n=1 Tax=Magnetospira sp. (strain QH-2) TaxID=1288970 RepID=UPI0003E812D8|nr:adenylate/guanylate cyclase domain-containing protein [Magnetospira sp. QH-2]CCQ73590.1 Conserved protein of unknown function. Containing adenylate/guanylate cyclase fragment domain [Magnetospira sp. QH-2]